tara:strand:- start:231 stop:554 length:324 start_codon:yes stop_codon:yes gene_type:complete
MSSENVIAIAVFSKPCDFLATDPADQTSRIVYSYSSLRAGGGGHAVVHINKCCSEINWLVENARAHAKAPFAQRMANLDPRRVPPGLVGKRLLFDGERVWIDAAKKD